jgi:hypothetical protein
VTEVSLRDVLPGNPGKSIGNGALRGKRYSDETTGLEVLCTSQGTGELGCSEVSLEQTVAKQLASSD